MEGNEYNLQYTPGLKLVWRRNNEVDQGNNLLLGKVIVERNINPPHSIVWDLGFRLMGKVINWHSQY